MVHIPVRTCVSCRRADAQHALVRLAMVDGRITVDPTGHGPGRGAYLCPTAGCVDRALRRDGAALRRALRTDRSAGPIDSEGLAALLPRRDGTSTSGVDRDLRSRPDARERARETRDGSTRRPPGAAKSVTARPSGVVE